MSRRRKEDLSQDVVSDLYSSKFGIAPGGREREVEGRAGR